MLLLRCAARSARARPLGASHGVAITATNALAFSNRAETTAQNAADVRDLLRTRLSLTDAELDRVVRHKPAGARATVEPKLVWLQSRLDLDDARLRKILLLLPRVLGFSVENNLAPTLDWLQKRLDLDEEELKKMVVAFPALLGLSVEDNMAPKLDWLQKRLDLDDAGVRRLILALPALLGYSVEDNMEPKLDWLQDRLNLDAAQLKKVVVPFPALLGYRVEDNLAPKLQWLQTRLDLDAEQLRKIVLRLPPVLSYSVEATTEPKLEWLQKRLDLDDEQLRKIVLRLPTVLSYSVKDNMKPKLEFLAREIGLTRDELRDWVVNNPVTLSRSLERCYRIRLEACRAASVDGKRVLSYAKESDKIFCKRTGIDPEDLAAIQESQTLNLNDFSAARVVPCETGGKKLVASGPFPAGAVLFRFTGELSPINIGDRSLQVGRAAHLLSVPPEEPWVYLNHSFEPTVSLIVDPVAPVATARTTEDLSDGAALTIDYTLHEWDMSGDGFVCSESGRRVRGFKYLSESEREAALPRAAPHIREMAGE